MSAVLNNALQPWGFDSNKFLGSVRPDQRKKHMCPRRPQKHKLLTTSLGNLEDVYQFSSGNSVILFNSHRPEALVFHIIHTFDMNM